MRGGVEDALAFEALEIARQVVDEVVRAKNGFVAAEDVMRGRDEGEVALEPAVFGAERVGDGHGLGGDEDFELLRKLLQDVLCVGHQRKIFKEVFGIEEGAKLLLAVERSNLPQRFAGQVLRAHGFVECLVVAAEMFGKSVGHDLIHVDTDATHESGSGLMGLADSAANAGNRLGLRSFRGRGHGWIPVKNAAATVAGKQHAFAQLVPHLGPDAHAAADTLLIVDAGEAGAFGAGEAIVANKPLGTDERTEGFSLGIQDGEFGGEFLLAGCGADTGFFECAG